MSATIVHDQPAVRDVQQRAAIPREREVGDSDGGVRFGALSVALYAAGALLLGLSMFGKPIDLYPELLTSVAIILFALVLRAAGGRTRTSASISSDGER